MDIYEAIFARRSIRAFDGRPIDRDVLDRLMRAATAAPSSGNSQPWLFHVATGATREAVGHDMALSTLHMKEYLDSLPPENLDWAQRFFATLGDAPVAVALSLPVSSDELQTINDFLAAGCAVENLQLAATAEGIGCCHLTFSFFVRDKLAETLDIPEGRQIVSLIILGHPAETPEPPGRRDDVVTYFD